MRCCDSSPSFSPRIGCLRLAIPAPSSLTSPEPSRSPRFLGSPCTYAAFSDPGRTFAPSHEDDRGRGESLLPTAFARGSSPLSVPQSAPDRCLAASRRFGCAPGLLNARRLRRENKISGLHRAASVLAVYASQPASRRSTQDSLAVSGQLFLLGILTRWAPCKVSASTSLPPHPSFLAQ